MSTLLDSFSQSRVKGFIGSSFDGRDSPFLTSVSGTCRVPTGILLWLTPRIVRDGITAIDCRPVMYAGIVGLRTYKSRTSYEHVEGVRLNVAFGSHGLSWDIIQRRVTIDIKYPLAHPIFEFGDYITASQNRTANSCIDFVNDLSGIAHGIGLAYIIPGIPNIAVPLFTVRFSFDEYFIESTSDDTMEFCV